MSGYIGVEPVTQVTKVRTFGTLAVASTTIPVAGGFSPGNIEVYINGDYVLPTDYNESDGLTIVFSITLDAGTDYVVIEARQFLVADTWSKAEADARYAEITGGADANFAAMPQVGGAPIVESGSNIDGEWTRWADGTQVVSKEACIATYSNSARLDFNSSTPISFLSAFKASASVDSTVSLETLGYDSKGSGQVVVKAVSSSVNIRLYNGGTGFVSGDTISISYVAIGRWK